MKKTILWVCIFAMLAAMLCSCSANTCEHCGESAMMLNQVGDDVDGINVCDTCIEKMRYSKINFNFTCDGCHQDKVGKENEIVVDGENKVVCNTCNTYFAENGKLPQ